MDRQGLIEAVAGPWRAVGRDRVRTLPAWRDLDAAGRVEAYEASLVNRRLEAGHDPEGLSGTARAVLDRIGA